MNKKIKVLGLIVARGKSKGVPRKNLRDLCGQPLIRYTIETAKRANSLAYVALSTDDIEIAELARSYGCDVPFLRPAELATDTATIIPVITHAIKSLSALGHDFDAILLLQPTNPLRTVSDIENAISFLGNDQVDSVLSVSKVEDNHPARMKLIGASGYLEEPAYAAKKFDAPRQSFDDVYLRNGSIYLFRKNLILEKQRIMGDKCRPLIIPRERAFNIDDEIDFTLVENLLRSRKGTLLEVVSFDK